MASTTPDHRSTPSIKSFVSDNDPYNLTPTGSNVRSHRYSSFDTKLFGTYSRDSPTQTKRALEAHLADTDRRIQDASNLGTTLLEQKREMAARLREIEAQEPGSRVGADMRQKLDELEREYNEVGLETARQFIPKTPRQKNGSLDVAVDTAVLTATGHPTPSKPSAPSRKQRNGPSSHVQDIEFATEISTSLLAQVRQLQAILTEKEEEVKKANAENSKLQSESDIYALKMRSFDENEQRFRDDTWQLEMQMQTLMIEIKDAATREQRLTQSLTTARNHQSSAEHEYDELRVSHDKISADHEILRRQHESEVTGMQRSLAAADTEKDSLQKQIEELSTQNEDLARAAAYRNKLDQEIESLNFAGDDNAMTLEPTTPEHYPSGSPVKATPRHGALESETLKSSLHHAHRMIQNLKNNIHREKTEKLELKRMLQDARDELEARKTEGGTSAANAGRKRLPAQQGGFKKPLHPGMLGGAKGTQEEVINDASWEEYENSPTRPRLAGHRDLYDLSTDASDAFETAHERDSITSETTDGFRTGLESMADSADELTETEESHGLRSRDVALARLNGGRRQSFESTASDDVDSFDFSTPDPKMPSRYKVKVNRGPQARLHGQDNVQSSPASFISDITGADLRRNLAAELDNLGGTTESIPSSTPARTIQSTGVSPQSFIASPQSYIRDLTPGRFTGLASATPKIEMVDVGTMTESWEPLQSTELHHPLNHIEEPTTSDTHIMSDEPSNQRTPQQFRVQSSQQRDPEPLGSAAEMVSKSISPLSQSKTFDNEPSTAHLEVQPLRLSSTATLGNEPITFDRGSANEVRSETSQTHDQDMAKRASNIELSPQSAQSPNSNVPRDSRTAGEEEMYLSSTIPDGVDNAAKVPNSATNTKYGTAGAVWSFPPIDQARTTTENVQLMTKPESDIAERLPAAGLETIESQNTGPDIALKPSSVDQDQSPQQSQGKPTNASSTLAPVHQWSSVQLTPTNGTTMSQHQPDTENKSSDQNAASSSMAFVNLLLKHPSSPTTNAANVQPDVTSMGSMKKQDLELPEDANNTDLSQTLIKVLETSHSSTPETSQTAYVPVVNDPASTSENTDVNVTHPQVSSSTGNLVSERVNVTAQPDFWTSENTNVRPVEASSTVAPSFHVSYGANKDELLQESTLEIPDAPETVDRPPFRAVSGNAPSAGPGISRIRFGDEEVHTPAEKVELLQPEHPTLNQSKREMPRTVSFEAGISPGKSPAASRTGSMNSRTGTIDVATYMDPETFGSSDRKESMSSLSKATSNSMMLGPPPLPTDHRTNIAAASRVSSLRGSMPPPPPPSSSARRTSSSQRQRQSSGNGNPSPMKTSRNRAPSFGRGDAGNRTSMSSFASDIDERFSSNLPSNGSPGNAEPFEMNASTDPRMIQAITQTMIGEYLWKYTRKTGRSEHSENRHRRFFWIHPYTRMLYWSNQDPSRAGRAELKAKSVAIEAVRVVSDDNSTPPGLHPKSIIVVTPGRNIKFTAPTSQRHETWFNALSYLLLRNTTSGRRDDLEAAHEQQQSGTMNHSNGSRSNTLTSIPSITSEDLSEFNLGTTSSRSGRGTSASRRSQSASGTARSIHPARILEGSPDRPPQAAEGRPSSRPPPGARAPSTGPTTTAASTDAGAYDNDGFKKPEQPTTRDNASVGGEGGANTTVRGRLGSLTSRISNPFGRSARSKSRTREAEQAQAQSQAAKAEPMPPASTATFTSSIGTAAAVAGAPEPLGTVENMRACCDGTSSLPFSSPTLKNIQNQSLLHTP